MKKKPQADPFDWELFDAQPYPVKQVTWEHNIYATFPVMPGAAKAIARMMAPRKAKKKVKANGP